MPLIRNTLLLPFTLFAFFIGKINWTMPPWLAYLNELRKRSLLKFLLLIVVFVLSIFGLYKAYDYYTNLPEPILVTANIDAPETMAEFVYDELPAPPVAVVFSYNKPKADGTQPSIAPIEKLGSAVESGIKLTPAKEGQWLWQSDRVLSFAPSTPWPPGETYTVSFAPEVFSTNDEFTSDSFTFTTSELKATLRNAAFELDPQTNEKTVLVEYDFNYALDLNSLNESVSMAKLNLDKTKEPITDFKIKLSDDRFSATVFYTLDKLPESNTIVQTTISKGLRAELGGEALTKSVEAQVTVPDVYSYLKVDDFRVDILRSPENDPDQFVLLRFTDPVSRADLLDKLNMYRLPKDGERHGKSYWQNPREVTTQVRNNASKIEFELMPTKSDSSKTFQLRIDETPNAQFYFRLDAGLRSANGFIYKSFYDRIFSAPAYPQEVVINGEGSLMTYSKEQRLAFTTRGVNAVKVSIGKVINDELYHLVSQTRGDISQPNFNSWSFGPENLASFSERLISVTNSSNTGNSVNNAKDARYASVDLSRLISRTNNEIGLFFIEIKGWDNHSEREIYGVSDKLLLLVTDLGVIVKSNADNSQEVFVQSIEKGKPVANAKVELLGKNGVPLFNVQTNENGHVSLPPIVDFTKEKEPTVFVVSRDGDVSFIPYNRYSRQINYSRFDVSGLYDYGDNDNDAGVSAFVFSDRGIYRPGESVELAGIIKGKGFSELAGIPLELVIRDSQYNEVNVHPFRLPDGGMFEYRFNTETSFSTGDYSASLHLVNRQQSRAYRDRQVGSVNFSVEAFQPDTMAISNEVESISENKGWLTGLTLANKITLTNLFGSPAQQRDAISSMTLSPTSFSFDVYEGFNFNALGSKNNSEIERLDLPQQEGITDASGVAAFTFDLTDTPIGKLKAGAFLVRNAVEGFEASSGRSVTTASAFRYSPLPYMLGFKADGKLNFLKKNSERSVAVVAIDNQLNSIALENVEAKLSVITSVSTLVEQYNGRYQYESIERKEVVSSDKLNITAFEQSYQLLTLSTKEAGEFVLEFFDEQGRLLSAVEYTVVGDNNDTGKLEKEAELALKLNKSDFKPGEIIELSIQAPYAGSGLITIESNKMHSFAWFSTSTKNSIQRIAVPAGLEGNAYVNVAFVRDIASPEILTSPLSYAVQPFFINRDSRKVSLEITTPEIAEPGKPLNINVDLDQDAKLVVFAVDIGILNVANYKTPRPLDFFLQKRALSVRTMQILDLILPDFALSKMLSAAGGGDAFADELKEAIMVSGSRITRNENPFARQERKPVVFWSGIVDGKKGGNALAYNIPDDFNGGLRVMAIASGQGTVGRAQQSLVVRGPFVLSPSILNQSAPGDEFDVSLSVANLIDDLAQAAGSVASEASNAPRKHNITVKVSTSEHLSFLANGDNAEDEQKSLKLSMQLASNQEDVLRFRVKANDILGEATVSFDVSMTDASGKTYQASRSVKTSIRPAAPYTVGLTTGVASNGEVNIDSPKALFSEESAYFLRASSSPLVVAEGLSDYLAEYPHGCTEQIVSQVFPIIGLSNLDIYQQSDKANTALAHFNELVSKLRTRQSYSGGFSYWSNRQDDNFEVSIYVMHFLLDAQEVGYPVPNDMLQSGMNYLDNILSRFSAQNVSAFDAQTQLSLHNRAHAIYLLTKRGVVTSNLIIDWLEDAQTAYQSQTAKKEKKREKHWENEAMGAYIAASYALMQRSDEAQRLIQSYVVRNNTDTALQAISGEAPVLALNAQYLYLVAKHFPSLLDSVAPELLLSLTEAIYAGQYNTLSASYGTLALGAYHAATASVGSESTAADSDILFGYVAKGEERNTEALQTQLIPFPTVNYSAVASVAERVSATLSGKALYYVDVQAGFASELPTEAIKQGIEIQRSFVDEDGNVLNSLKQGEKATVRLRIRSTDKAIIDNVAIVDLLPGGFEVLRESVNRNSGPTGTWRGGVSSSDHADIRDDRVVFYTTVNKSIKEITYTIQATAAGEFVVPPSFAESMYDRNIKGQSVAGKFVVLAE